MRPLLSVGPWLALVSALAFVLSVLAAAPPAQAQDEKPPSVENLRCVAKTDRVAFLWDEPDWPGGEVSSYDYDLTLPDGRRENARIIKDGWLLYRPGTYRTGTEARVSIWVNYEASGGGTVASDEKTLVCHVTGNPQTPVPTPTATSEPTQAPTTNTDATGEQTPQEKYADLIARMRGWRNNPQWNSDKSHTDRWDRALLAFGETVADTTLISMTAAEAQEFADRGWTRWVDVAAALEDIESSGQQQTTPNHAPTVSTAIADVTIVNESGTRRVSLSGVFSDADSDALTVTAVSSTEAVATTEVAADDSALTVTAKARGTATITVTADDGNGGTVSDAFAVRVKAAPAVASALADVSNLEVGSTQDVSLSSVFSDAEDDSLTITAAPSNQAVATVAVALDGSTLTVEGVAEGTATITVTAQDSDGNRVSDTFNVAVTAPPQQVQTPQEKYADLIAQMYEWRNDPQHSYYKSHTDRWDRALLAFGETVADTTLFSMTAAEAQELVDRGWTRWVDVAAALRDMPERSLGVYGFIESNVVEKYEDEHPWLREAWDGMERAETPVVVKPLPYPQAMRVGRCRNDVPGSLLRCGKYRLEVDPSYARNVRSYVHELAHFWTLNFGVMTEATAPIAMGHIYFDRLKESTNCNAPALELYVEAITYAVVGAITSPYWCSELPPIHSEEVQNVTNSVLEKQTPQWFIDEYQNQNGSWKLEEIWTDVKNLGHSKSKNAVTFHFRQSFGGYCPYYNDSPYLIYYYGGILGAMDLISNPWRNGRWTCPPSAPQNTAITPGDRQLTVSWEAPADNGGSPITGYLVRWTRQGAPSWTSETLGATSTSYTITELGNGILYNVEACALTMFSRCGEVAKGSGTPADGTVPVVASALADMSNLEVGSTQDVSLSGVFSDADSDSLTITAASSDDAKATVTVASDGSKLTVEGVTAGEATITVTAQDADGNQVSDAFDVAVVKAPEPEPADPEPPVDPEPPEPPPPVEDEPVSSDIVAQYDANGDGSIDVKEYISALRAYAQGQFTNAELKKILDAYLAWAYG